MPTRLQDASREISIHALREEGDKRGWTGSGRGKPFLSTPSARRATRLRMPWPPEKQLFLSTPSARRATFAAAIKENQTADFYPRPPRGGRLFQNDPCKVLTDISIHALREEGDFGFPARHSHIAISIHALREEGDRLIPGLVLRVSIISIHALREEGDALIAL